MINAYIPNNFVPERTYAIRALFYHVAGIDVTVTVRPHQPHYEFSWDQKSIVIRDHFFGQTFVGETYLDPDRIPEKMTSSIHEDIMIIHGHDSIEVHEDRIISEIDLIAGTFFMLTRWEESFGLHEDLHGRFPAKESLSMKSDCILRPVIDEYGMLVKMWVHKLGYASAIRTDTYTVVPTCDVDIPYYWKSKSMWRLLASRFLMHKSYQRLKEDYRTMEMTRKGIIEDPYDTFDYLMALAEENNKRFIFYMLGGKETKFEGYYDINDTEIKALMQRMISRGHSLGLHPSYNTFHDGPMLKKEKVIVEKSSGVSLSMSRQHYLRFAVPDTWRHLYDAYLKEDSTLGYAAEPGFRCGTSKAFPVFDIHQRKELTVTEKPLLIMDVSLKGYKNFTVAESLVYCKKIVEQVKKHQGHLVFLWHNSSLAPEDGWGGWNEVIEYLMKTESN